MFKRHSKASREVLLKNVVQAIPTYAMSVFLLPSKLCHEIEIAMNSYWWNADNNSGKGIRWKDWKALNKPKKLGRMGYRTLREFNLSLLGKQTWRFIQQPHSLVSKVYKAKYFPKVSYLDAKIGSNPSFVWRSVCQTQNIIKDNCV